MLRDWQAAENGRIFPFFCVPKMGVKLLFSYSKEDIKIALVFIMYDGSLTTFLGESL